MNDTFLRFLRFLIDVDNKLPVDFSTRVYSSPINAAYFLNYSAKDNEFNDTAFSLLFTLCAAYYEEYRVPPTDITILLKIRDDTKLSAVQKRDIEVVVNALRQIPLEETQFSIIQDSIRKDYIKNNSYQIYQNGLHYAKEDPLKGLKYVQNSAAELIASSSVEDSPEEHSMFLWQLMEFQLQEIEKHGDLMHGGIPYGFIEFDRTLGGMYPGELIIICGPPGVGKSLISSAIGYGVADTGKKVVMVSREMLYSQISLRYISRLTKIPSKALKRLSTLSEAQRNVVDAAMRDLVSKQDNSVFFIPPSKSYTVNSIARGIEEVFGDENPDLIIVDYLNEIEVEGRETGYERIGVVTQQLKNLAIKFKCPVISPTQPSSAGLSAATPTMADVGYKIINQKADTIFFLTEDPDNRYVPPFIDTNPGVPGTILTKVIKARNDAKPLHPLKLQVEYSTATVGNFDGLNTAIARTIE